MEGNGVLRPERARVEDRHDTLAHPDPVRVEATRLDQVEDVRVSVHPPRSDDQPAGVENVRAAGTRLWLDGADHAGGNRDVGAGERALRHLEYLAALYDK